MMEQELNKVLGERFGKTIEEACMEEIYHALLTIVKGKMKDLKKNTGSRKLYYISAEFLIGKLLSNNLINLGLFDETAEVLKKHGIDIARYRGGGDWNRHWETAALEDWAACFLDSIATLEASRATAWG